MSAPRVIAIDGPAASGKSSVARFVAQQLGWNHLNTGNMYRAATWAALRDGIDVKDEAAVTAALARWNFRCNTTDGRAIILVDGRDVESELNSGEVNNAVSFIACVPAVRNRLVAMQREIGLAQPSVIEGRDIGTVVFPDAPAKFYIDASEVVRAKRRGLQGQADAVGERDRMDSTRKIAPLKPAADAIVVDSSDLTLDQVLSAVMQELAHRGIRPPQS